MGHSPWGHKESDTAEYACIPLTEMCSKETFTEVYEDTMSEDVCSIVYDHKQK